jgi:hypothetical protein
MCLQQNQSSSLLSIVLLVQIVDKKRRKYSDQKRSFCFIAGMLVDTGKSLWDAQYVAAIIGFLNTPSTYADAKRWRILS